MMFEITSDKDLLHYADLLELKINQIKTKDSFIGKIKNGFYIVNLDNITGPGTHWAVFFCHNNYVVYFDSFGLSPPMDIIQFCNKKQIIYSTDHIQDIKSDACGYYCIAFIQFFNNIPKKNLQTNKQMGYYLNNFLKPFDVQNKKKNEKILATILKDLLKNL